MKLDGIVFDLDDTLFDTTRRLLPAADRRAAAALSAHGVALDDESIVRRVHELRAAGVVRVFAAVAEEQRARAGAAEAAEHAFFAYADAVPPLDLDPRVAAALDLVAAFAPLALLTTGDPQTQRRKIERLGFAARFAECRVVDFRFPGGKTAALAELIRDRGWTASRVLMVGDRPDGDVRAGNRCGCLTVLVRREGAEFANVAAASPDDVPWRVVAHVAELPALLETVPRSAEREGPRRQV